MLDDRRALGLRKASRSKSHTRDCLTIHAIKPASSRWRVFPFYELVCFMPDDDQDIRISLARAFDRAWGRYYRSGRLTVGEDVARTELARRLVQLSKEGIRDEGRLAEAGLSHLRQLTLKGGRTEA
jgi:hypothetical protein